MFCDFCNIISGLSIVLPAFRRCFSFAGSATFVNSKVCGSVRFQCLCSLQNYVVPYFPFFNYIQHVCYCYGVAFCFNLIKRVSIMFCVPIEWVEYNVIYALFLHIIGGGIKPAAANVYVGGAFFPLYPFED